ncbi:hypothetical protein CCMA1212_005228 [Trichoderma ghanense]|uniref:Uncharacterized protein n=1 Tax=Trichoderma ghanense TaxID=65468 RepID=A0ABY2H3Y5_9HYPO
MAPHALVASRSLLDLGPEERLVVCLAGIAIVAVYLCIKRRREEGRDALRNRPPTPIARARLSSDNEETENPPIPLVELPAAARIAGKRAPANTEARRPGCLSGMEVAKPLQIPFLDTVVEAASSEERVCQNGAGDHVEEDAGHHLDKEDNGKFAEVKRRGES